MLYKKHRYYFLAVAVLSSIRLSGMRTEPAHKKYKKSIECFSSFQTKDTSIFIPLLEQLAASDENHAHVRQVLAAQNHFTYEASQTYRPLFAAASNYAILNTKALLMQGFYNPIHDSYPETLLHRICDPALDTVNKSLHAKRIGIAHLLKEFRIDPNAKDTFGKTALFYLLTEHYKGNSRYQFTNKNDELFWLSQRRALITILLQSGANPFAKDAYGDSAFTYAYASPDSLLPRLAHFTIERQRAMKEAMKEVLRTKHKELANSPFVRLPLDIIQLILSKVYPDQ